MFEAGLWREGRASQLILSIESEAASVWCLDQVIKSGQKKFLLVDVGGGTTDISAHEVLRGRGLRQLCESRGISYGGDNVNKRYAKMLATILGDGVMGDFKSKHAADYLDHMRGFEEQKRIFRPNQSDGISLSIQNSLLTVYEEHTRKKFKQAFTDYNPDIIDYEDNRIHIKTEGVTKMFGRVIQKILKHIEVMQRETEGIDKVLLVGGFSGCPMLQGAVRETFQGQGRVVVPDHPGLCVVKGAVQYGFRSDVITSRVAKRTYGFLHCKRYDPDLHDEKRARLIEIDDTQCCSNLVKRIVTKGENVAQDFEFSVLCRPVRRDQREIELILLSFSDPDVKYYNLEEKPELHTKIVLPVNAGGQVQIRCLFEGTEIRLLARDADGLSDWHETTVGFLCY
uniref:Heat shock protein family A member 12 variant X12 n=1 Tax=Urechis unicinctus TaxID=6432 RepID=A0AAU0MUX9_UREUN